MKGRRGWGCRQQGKAYAGTPTDQRGLSKGAGGVWVHAETTRQEAREFLLP